MTPDVVLVLPVCGKLGLALPAAVLSCPPVQQSTSLPTQLRVRLFQLFADQRLAYLSLSSFGSHSIDDQIRSCTSLTFLLPLHSLWVRSGVQANQ